MATVVLAVLLAGVLWLVLTDAPIIRFVVRLYRDKYFLRDTVAAWGWMAPLVFMAIQALQVIISPIPGRSRVRWAAPSSVPCGDSRTPPSD